jgi:hypothetical protein
MHSCAHAVVGRMQGRGRSAENSSLSFQTAELMHCFDSDLSEIPDDESKNNSAHPYGGLNIH